jgi:hypothetical protein
MELEDWNDAVDAWTRLTRYVWDDPDIFDAQAIALARINDFCGAHKSWENARKFYKKRGDEKESSRVTELGRAARINCSRLKKIEKAQREHEKATRTFSDRHEIHRKKKR